jgi:enoyl-CoA hydratase/carnithine racemase
MMAEPSNVKTSRLDGGVVLIRLNRPQALNALNLVTRRQLAGAFTALHDDDTVRAIVLAGDEKAFAAGADLQEFVDAGPIEIMKRKVERYWAAITQTPQPVIAAVRGYALGGGMELALACDIIIAAEDAQLGLPEPRVGIMPGAGGTQRLVRAVGKYRAMHLCLTAKPVSGQTAFNMGLVSQSVPDAEVEDTAVDLARSIARLPPLAAASIKEAINLGESAPLDTALTLERKAFQLLFASHDKTEGMTAFLEKRKPEFTGE